MMAVTGIEGLDARLEMQQDSRELNLVARVVWWMLTFFRAHGLREIDLGNSRIES
jgi:hypothetical protein